MKRLVVLPLCLALMSAPALAGNVDAAMMEPEVIEAAASSNEGLMIMGIMVAIVLLAALSSTSGGITPLD